MALDLAPGFILLIGFSVLVLFISDFSYRLRVADLSLPAFFGLLFGSFMHF